jgi:putative FmdB family regulatory protein
MPIYEFVCQKCRKEFEIRQSMSGFDASGVVCPDCGSREVERRWSSIYAVTGKKS